MNRNVLKEVEQSTSPTKVDEVELQAIKNIRSSNNTSAIKDQMVEKARKEFAAAKAEYGDSLPVTLMDDIKSTQWKATKFDSAVPQLERDVHYAVGNAYKDAIEKRAMEAGATDVAQLNRHIGDIQEAAKFLEGLNGKVVKGGTITRLTSRLIGATAGAHFGVLGTILGAVTGDAVAGALVSNSIATPVKRLILKQIEQTDPAAYKRAIQWLKDQKIFKKELLQIGPGDATRNPVPIPLNGPTSFEPAAKRITTSSPAMKLLPAGTPGGATGVPISLPESISAQRMGLDEIRGLKKPAPVSRPSQMVQKAKKKIAESKNLEKGTNEELLSRLAKKHQGNYLIIRTKGNGEDLIKEAINSPDLPPHMKDGLQKSLDRGFYKKGGVYGMSFDMNSVGGGAKPVIVQEGKNLEGAFFHEVGHYVNDIIEKTNSWNKGWGLRKQLEKPEVQKSLGLLDYEKGSLTELTPGLVRVFYTGTKGQKELAGKLLKAAGLLSLVPIVITQQKKL